MHKTQELSCLVLPALKHFHCHQHSTYLNQILYEADLHVNLDGCKTIEGMGIGFIYIMQMLAYEKAICKGCNPDVPEGLDAYITL